MTNILDFILLILSQFAGGPGPVENNLVRFGLAAIMWAVLFYIAWSRHRSEDFPREKLLVWGFGLAFVRELYMFSLMAWRLLGNNEGSTTCDVFPPLEHALAMAAMVVVAAAFIRYILDDQAISRKYLITGLSIMGVVFVYSTISWPLQLETNPDFKFHQTWSAWLFHVPLAVLMGYAVVLLWKERGWLRNLVAGTLSLYLISELLLLLNYATNQAYNRVICPIGNALHILVVPLLGYIYLREQSLEKKQAEESLQVYKNHLEDLVKQRTTELSQVNSQLEKEVLDRILAELALERLTQRYSLILESAGEGICGIDRNGIVSFANPAAARCLGYSIDELLNRPSHAIWHQHRADGTPYPLEECPIFQGYTQGIQHYGDNEYFWRKNGTSFPVNYFSNPIWENKELVGVVIVFTDITERKRSEEEIALNSAKLATQKNVADELSQSLEVSETIMHVLEIICRDTGMDFGAIFLSEPKDGSLSLFVATNYITPDEKMRSGTDDGVISEISKQAWLLNDIITQNTTAGSPDSHSKTNVEIGLQSLISVPLVSKGNKLGVMTLGTLRSEAVPVHTVGLLTAIGQQISMAIENARLYKEAEEWANELTRLHEASAFLSSSFDFDRVTNEIARQSAWLLDCQKSFIVHRDNETMPFELAAIYSISQTEQEILAASIPEWDIFLDPTGQLTTISIQDVTSEPRVPKAIKNLLNIKAALLIPVWSADIPNDYIVLLDTLRTRRWDAREMELIEIFSNRAGVALAYASLQQQLELAATLQERQRIAADMHDGLSQTISLLGMRVDRVQELVDDGNKTAIDAEIRAIRDILFTAYSEVRRLIKNFQAMPLQRESFQEMIQNIISRLNNPVPPEISFDKETEPPLFLPADQTDQILLIIQEAIVNACRHAQAQFVFVSLNRSGSDIHIEVVDDGCGFDGAVQPESGDHFGFTIMQARANRIGGKLQIVSSPGKGTRVELDWTPTQIK